MRAVLRGIGKRSEMLDKIKIVYLIDELNIGGTEKQLLATLDRLDRAKFEPFLVCLRTSKYYTQCNVQCHKHLLNVGSLASFDGLEKLIEFARFLREQDINIIQTFFFDSTVFGGLAAKLARVKKIISCRRDMGFWYTPKLLMVLRVINLIADRILVNSQAIKDNVVLKEHVRPGKIDVVYNGIDLGPFSEEYDVASLRSELGVPAADRIVGIVANLNRQVKRVDLFIEAAAQVLKKEKQVSFVIVGEGNLRKQLEQQARELGVLNKVHFVGLQDNVIPYLQLFDIGVLTSESEGFSNSILEYMATGLPGVCFDPGGNGEMIVDGVNGYLVSNFSTSILSDRICMLLADSLMMRSIGKKNVEDIKMFSWSTILEQLTHIYMK